MKKPFNIHDWQAKRRLTEEDEFQKRQDRLTPGKNPGEFYGGDSLDKLSKKSQESMSNADIRALQIVVGDYSLNKLMLFHQHKQQLKYFLLKKEYNEKI